MFCVLEFFPRCLLARAISGRCPLLLEAKMEAKVNVRKAAMEQTCIKNIVIGMVGVLQATGLRGGAADVVSKSVER